LTPLPRQPDAHRLYPPDGRNGARAADAVDRKLRSGETLGALEGVAFVLKDTSRRRLRDVRLRMLEN
jgi:Asp-tRNA(Asn)/Glu-tRNA(Gln) amidotransferase A subunit family amidase